MAMILIEASEGKILTDGMIYGKQIWYSGRDREEFWEITEEEYQEILLNKQDDQ